MNNLLIFALLAIASASLCFMACDDSGSDKENHSTLTLEGTVEYVFDYSADPFTWTRTYSHTDGCSYVLQNKSDDAILASDDGDDASIDISIETPPDSSLSDLSDYPTITSSHQDARVLDASVEIWNGSAVVGDGISEGDFSQVESSADTSKGRTYMYFYSTEKTTLGGYVDFGNGPPVQDQVYDDLELNKGWTRVINTPSSDGSMTFSNGTIDDAVWFSLEG